MSRRRFEARGISQSGGIGLAVTHSGVSRRYHKRMGQSPRMDQTPLRRFTWSPVDITGIGSAPYTGVWLANHGLS